MSGRSRMVSARVPVEVADLIDGLAEKLGVPRSAVVATACVRLAAVAWQSDAEKHSLYDQVRHMTGYLKDNQRLRRRALRSLDERRAELLSVLAAIRDGKKKPDGKDGGGRV